MLLLLLQNSFSQVATLLIWGRWGRAANFHPWHSCVLLEAKYGFGFNQVEVPFSADPIFWGKAEHSKFHLTQRERGLGCEESENGGLSEGSQSRIKFSGIMSNGCGPLSLHEYCIFVTFAVATVWRGWGKVKLKAAFVWTQTHSVAVDTWGHPGVFASILFPFLSLFPFWNITILHYRLHCKKCEQTTLSWRLLTRESGNSSLN